MLYDLPERARLILRDTVYLVRSVKRRVFDSSKSPLILCNSYPKSGTHMLSQILENIPNVKYWNDIVSVQSLSGVMNSKEHIRYKLSSVPGGSLVRSHLMYSDEILSVLSERDYKKLFIYRDPRDVVISHANWVMKEPKIYLNKIYTECYEDNNQRIMASIEGVPLGKLFGSSSSQPDIAQDFERWKGWINDPQTLAIRFEDLVGERGGGDENKRQNLIRDIFKHIGYDVSDEDLISMFSSHSMNPEKSHTFRKGNKGSIAGWKNKFTNEHKDTFKKVTGKLLIELGYEKDMDW